MAYKKTARRTGSDPTRDRDLKAVRLLAGKALKELERLLVQEEAGTITRVNLSTGLEELAQELKQINVFQHKL